VLRRKSDVDRCYVGDVAKILGHLERENIKKRLRGGKVFKVALKEKRGAF